MGTTAQTFFSLATSDLATETSFFSELKMPNGTFKLTRPSRFVEIEEAFGTLIQRRAGGIRMALDVGVSSGITTIELANFLKAKGACVRMVATDLFIRAHIVDLSSRLRVLANPTGWPLQYDVNGIAIRPWIRRLDFPTFAFVPRLVARVILQPLLRALIKNGKTREVCLVSPRLAHYEDLDIIEDDILKRSVAFINRFDFIRVANLLNRSSFTDSQILIALENIRSYLRGPDALLLIARTNGIGQNSGSLFELDNSRFQVIGRIGNGSEVEGLVLRMNRRH